jgi:tRNA(Ile)-lysidine synthase
MNPFEAAVAAALGGACRGKVLLASVSGGADSTAMLAALAALEPELGFTLHCIHIDHGIRPPAESRGDGEFTAALCKKLKVPCRIVRVPPGRITGAAKKLGLGVEAAARIYRRRAWAREARRIAAEAVLTAHTRDDLLETTLMRVLRGSGPAGLAAMPVRRGLMLRPLLALGRADVLRYLGEKDLSHRVDATNTDNRFFRNAVRNRLVPLLDDLYPRWRDRLPELAETQRLTADFLAAEAAVRVHWEAAGGELRTGAAELFALPPIVREEALFRGIDALLAGAENPPPVKRSNIRKFSRGEGALDLGPCKVKRSAGQVILSRPAGKVQEAGFSLLIKAPGLYKLGGVRFEVFPNLPSGGPEAGRGFFAALPLLIRRCFGGDRLPRRGKKTGPEDLGAARSGALCALDAGGIAAFIGPVPGETPLLLDRDGLETEKSGPPAGVYYIRVR